MTTASISPHRRDITRACGAAAAVTLSVLALTGCATHDSTGRIDVTVSSAASSETYAVHVADASGQMVEHQRVFAGNDADFAGIPLGRVTVRAAGLCSVHTTVENGKVARVTLRPTGQC